MADDQLINVDFIAIRLGIGLGLGDPLQGVVILLQVGRGNRG